MPRLKRECWECRRWIRKFFSRVANWIEFGNMKAGNTHLLAQIRAHIYNAEASDEVGCAACKQYFDQYQQRVWGDDTRAQVMHNQPTHAS